MQTIVALFALVAVASAGVVSPVAYASYPGSYLTRAPAYDSAVIKSDRLGGNFAYSVAESHAYAQHTPIVQHVTSPIGVSYSAPAVHYGQAVHQYAGVPAVQYAGVQYAGAPAVSYSAGVYGASPYGYAAPGLGYSGYNTILQK